MPSVDPNADFGPSTQQLSLSQSPDLAADALPTGTSLGGYQIVEVLGRGDFGFVYLALDASLQRQVAIKEYLPRDLATRVDAVHAGPQVLPRSGVDADRYAAGLAEFLDEAKQLARFDHPALARVHSFWEGNRTAYMVMPYREGQSLAATLSAAASPPSEEWLRALLAPLLGALGVMHSAGHWHCNISPESIFMLADGQPVMMDLGSGSVVSSAVASVGVGAVAAPALRGVQARHADFAPLELWSEAPAQPLGPWTDLYALAAVLHFAITGLPPVRAPERAAGQSQRALTKSALALARPAGALQPQYSAAFLAAIDKALALRPKDRPRNAAEFQLLMGAGAEPSAGSAVAPADLPPVADPAVGGSVVDSPNQAEFAEPEREDSRPTGLPLEQSDAASAPAKMRPVTAFITEPGASSSHRRQAKRTAPVPVPVPPPKPIEPIFVAERAVVPPSKRIVRARRSPLPWLIALLGVVVLGVAWQTWKPRAVAPKITATPAAAVLTAPRVGASSPSLVSASASATPSVFAALTEAASAAVATVTPAAPSTSAPIPIALKAATSLGSAASSPETQASTPTPKPAPAPTPTPQAASAVRAEATDWVAEPRTPREVCGRRVNFSLYYCMQTQCKRPYFSQHAQCIAFRQRDDVR